MGGRRRAGDNLWLGEFPRLVSVAAHPIPEGGLPLAATGMEQLTVPPPTGATTPVGFSGLDRAVLADDSAHVWFTGLLGRPARLVWLDDPRRRSIDPAHGGLPGEVVSFEAGGGGEDQHVVSLGGRTLSVKYRLMWSRAQGFTPYRV
ncbi:hypothetical protein [Nonomuraea sp. NPDC050691]|uniref:hypothetical protein n=1 Tax=Nonomuraea sp. NPDC050691 TaxID=3155661 RepID=UPI0033E87B35